MKTIQCAHPPHHHNGFVATCRLWTASGGVHALDCLHDVTIYLYYALCFMLIEHSVCHEPIFVLINVYIYIYIHIYTYICICIYIYIYYTAFAIRAKSQNDVS